MTGPSSGSASSGSQARMTKRVVLWASSSTSDMRMLRPVDFGGKARGESADGQIVFFGDHAAEPAVSASGIALMPSLRSVLRHWPSAWVWLITRLTESSVAPGLAINWCGRAGSARR